MLEVPLNGYDWTTRPFVINEGVWVEDVIGQRERRDANAMSFLSLRGQEAGMLLRARRYRAILFPFSFKISFTHCNTQFAIAACYNNLL